MNISTNDSFESLKETILNHVHLTEKEWDLILKKLNKRSLKKNQFLISSGEICNKVWFISKGLIRYYQSDPEKNEQTTCFALENHFSTPFSSYLNNNPTHENLIALEPTEIVEITKADFLHLIETIPNINFFYRQVLERAYIEMENINYALQHYSALERYKKLIIEDAPELLKRVPLTYLASYLGISPETLSRVRAKL